MWVGLISRLQARVLRCVAGVCLAAAWWGATALAFANDPTTDERTFNIASASDLVTQLSDWIKAREHAVARDVEVSPVGSWRVPDSMIGEVRVLLTWRAIDRHHRQARIELIGAGLVATESARAPEIRFSVEDVERVWVAASPLAKGAVVDCAALRSESRSVSRTRGAWVGACATGAWQVQRSLDAGELVRASDLNTPADVEQGAEASVMVDVGAIRIDARAIALADGRVGQDIPVRLLGQSNVVHATVMAPGQLTLARNSK